MSNARVRKCPDCASPLSAEPRACAVCAGRACREAGRAIGHVSLLLRRSPARRGQAEAASAELTKAFDHARAAWNQARQGWERSRSVAGREAPPAPAAEAPIRPELAPPPPHSGRGHRELLELLAHYGWEADSRGTPRSVPPPARARISVRTRDNGGSYGPEPG